MRYKDAEQVKIEIKKLMLDKGLTQKEVAERLNLLPQGFTKLINKKNFSLTDLQNILHAMECELHIDFIQK